MYSTSLNLRSLISSVTLLREDRFPAMDLLYKGNSHSQHGHNQHLRRLRPLLLPLCLTSSNRIDQCSHQLIMAFPTLSVSFQSTLIRTIPRVSIRSLVAITAMLSTLKLNRSYLGLVWDLCHHNLPCSITMVVLVGALRLALRTLRIQGTPPTELRLM